MVYDTDFREAPCAAVDTAYPLTQRGADTPGSFVVATTASKITAIRILISHFAVNQAQQPQAADSPSTKEHSTKPTFQYSPEAASALTLS